MVIRKLRTTVTLAFLSAAIHAGCSSPSVESTGGETNWLATCADDNSCQGSAKCRCGVCTEECSSAGSCSNIAGSACKVSGSAAFVAACASAPIAGVCLATCGTDGCKGPTTCVDGVCVPAPIRDARDASTEAASDTAGCNAGLCEGPPASGNVCKWPADADSTSDGGDAGAAGCKPGAPLQICGPSSCSSACGAADYGLTCRGSATFGPAPEPDSSLNCSVIPIPTPSNELFYCCPCTP